MRSELSVILPVRNNESVVAAMVRLAAGLLDALVSRDGEELVGPVAPASHRNDDPLAGPPAGEILALDESSFDNTLSVLSVLRGQVGVLRVFQDVRPGRAIQRASQVARGDVWILFDRLPDPALARWGFHQVVRGHRAAIVPGEVLVVHRAVGVVAFGHLRGGLVCASRSVERHVRERGDLHTFSPAPDRSLAGRALTYVRGHLDEFGLGRFDRPMRGPGSPFGSGLL
jgi:hypothetical protein